MPEPRNAAPLLEAAEQAAMAGDFVAADELLREAARLQEADLGPLHPDLARTLNNLAIVAEKTGQIADAEGFYRRAAAISAASLEAGDPMIEASRENLEDFLRSQGLPVDPRAPAAAPPDPVPQPAAQPRVAVATRRAAQPAAAAVEPREPRVVQPARQPVAQAPPIKAATSSSETWLVIGVLVLLVVVAFIWRPWSSSETAAPTTTGGMPAAQSAEREPPPQTQPDSAPAPVAPSTSAAAVTRPEDRSPAATAPASGPVRGAVTLATVEVCRTLSTSGSVWRCDPIGASVPPGQLTLYTRVRTPRDVTVVHRWYRGDVLRQSVDLTVRANPTEGYRTYSRQTVDAGVDWRVEVRSASGDLLHERRFPVR